MVTDDEMLDQFKAMFDIGDGNVNNDDNDCKTTAENLKKNTDESFNVLSKEIIEGISSPDNSYKLDYQPSSKSVEDIISEASIEKDNTNIDQINRKITEKEYSKIDEIDNFDALPELLFNEEKNNEEIKEIDKEDDEIEEINEEVNEETKVEEEEKNNKIDEIGSLPEDEFKIENQEGINWYFESPSNIYTSFYKDKKELVQHFSIGGMIPFERYYRDIQSCVVDISDTTFDKDKMQKQMNEIQQCRNRIKEIQLRVNRQYFIWKRFVDMLRGCLSRVEYLKPQIKQEGLTHQHMRDVELYFCKLDEVHNSSNKADSNLEAAFNTLSRRVAICMEFKSGDRYQSRENENFSSSIDKPKPLDGYDQLPNNAKASSKDTGFIRWGEIG